MVHSPPTVPKSRKGSRARAMKQKSVLLESHQNEEISNHNNEVSYTMKKLKRSRLNLSSSQISEQGYDYNDDVTVLDEAEHPSSSFEPIFNTPPPKRARITSKDSQSSGWKGKVRSFINDIPSSIESITSPLGWRKGPRETPNEPPTRSPQTNNTTFDSISESTLFTKTNQLSNTQIFQPLNKSPPIHPRDQGTMDMGKLSPGTNSQQYLLDSSPVSIKSFGIKLSPKASSNEVQPLSPPNINSNNNNNNNSKEENTDNSILMTPRRATTRYGSVLSSDWDPSPSPSHSGGENNDREEPDTTEDVMVQTTSKNKNKLSVNSFQEEEEQEEEEEEEEGEEQGLVFSDSDDSDEDFLPNSEASKNKVPKSSKSTFLEAEKGAKSKTTKKSISVSNKKKETVNGDNNTPQVRRGRPRRLDSEIKEIELAPNTGLKELLSDQVQLDENGLIKSMKKPKFTRQERAAFINEKYMSIYDAVAGRVIRSGTRLRSGLNGILDFGTHEVMAGFKATSPDDALFQRYQNLVRQKRRHLLDKLLVNEGIFARPTYNDEEYENLPAEEKAKVDIYQELKEQVEIEIPAEMEEVPIVHHKSLPNSDLLNALHLYASNYYETRGWMQEFHKFDESALLALGVVVEEGVKNLLGPKGHMTYTENDPTAVFITERGNSNSHKRKHNLTEE